MSESVEVRAMRWALSSGTGISSKAICAHMTGTLIEDYNHPGDPSDLGRCLRLLEQIPEWRPRIHEMAQYTPGWAGLVEQWDEIADMYEEEGKGYRGQRTFKAMRLAIARGYREDERYECTFMPGGEIASWRKIA